MCNPFFIPKPKPLPAQDLKAAPESDVLEEFVELFAPESLKRELDVLSATSPMTSVEQFFHSEGLVANVSQVADSTPVTAPEATAPLLSPVDEITREEIDYILGVCPRNESPNPSLTCEVVGASPSTTSTAAPLMLSNDVLSGMATLTADVSDMAPAPIPTTVAPPVAAPAGVMPMMQMATPFLPTRSVSSSGPPTLVSKTKGSEIREYVEGLPTELDVLLGRGGRSNHHPGNKRYRTEVENLQEWYKQSPKADKRDLSQNLVNYVQSYGGRFLKLDKATGRWYIVPNKVARRKASQALREHIPMHERIARKQGTTSAMAA